MTKRRTPDAEPEALAFSPVPVRPRRDGWTPERQISFIRGLATTGCVATACRAVGMSTQTVYELYNRADAGSFRQAWNAATVQATVRLANEALSRATHGVATPVFYKGEQIGERRRYDDRLATWLLRHLAPDRFGAWRDQYDFRRGDADGAAKTLEYALRSLVGDLVADTVGKPRPRRDPVISETLDTPEEAEARALAGEEARRLREEAQIEFEDVIWQQRLDRIERGELRPGEADESDGDVASGSSA
jgi:hypothetical protein